MFGALLGTLKRFQNEEQSTYCSKVCLIASPPIVCFATCFVTSRVSRCVHVFRRRLVRRWRRSWRRRRKRRRKSWSANAKNYSSNDETNKLNCANSNTRWSSWKSWESACQKASNCVVIVTCNYYVFVAWRLGEADAHVDELRSNQVEALRLLSAEVAQRSFEEEARQQPGCSRRFESPLYPSPHPPLPQGLVS